MLIQRIHIRSFEVGLVFRRGEFARLLLPGKHWIWKLFRKTSVSIESRRDIWIMDDQLDLMIRKGVLQGQAEVLELLDHERAVVWVDGRFSGILRPGRHAYWIGFRDVKIERFDARQARFEHPRLAAIVSQGSSHASLEVVRIQRDCAGVLFLDGKYERDLGPGLYAFWRGVVDARVVEVDQREAMLDLSGQDIMTSDLVTLRLNAMVTYRIADAARAVSQSEDLRQSLYRDAQLVLREIVGQRSLEVILADKESVAGALIASLEGRASELGLSIVSAGVRDVILPGDMKDLLNKVMEAKKAAEANLIARREETAAMRSQANTAKLLNDNPTLMRLRELEVLEKIASTSNLQVILGEKGLSERVTHLL